MARVSCCRLDRRLFAKHGGGRMRQGGERAALGEPAETIRAVLFDFDGVLTTDKYGSDTTNRYLAQTTGLAFERVDQALERHNDALLLGR